MLGKIFGLVGSAIAAADEVVDINFTADEEAKESFASFKKLFPWATYRDWWDLEAHKQSRGALPDPTQTQSWRDRQLTTLGRREILFSALAASSLLLVPPKNPSPKNSRSPKFKLGQWVCQECLIDDDLDVKYGKSVITVGFITGMLLDTSFCRIPGWSYQIHVVIDRSAYRPCPGQLFHESDLKLWNGTPPV